MSAITPKSGRGSEIALPEAASQIELSAMARLLASDMREELLVLLRGMFERNAHAERLAYSPDEAAVAVSPRRLGKQFDSPLDGMRVTRRGE